MVKVLDSKPVSFYISGVTKCWALKYIYFLKTNHWACIPVICQPVNSCKQDRLQVRKWFLVYKQAQDMKKCDLEKIMRLIELKYHLPMRWEPKNLAVEGSLVVVSPTIIFSLVQKCKGGSPHPSVDNSWFRPNKVKFPY